MEVPVYIIHSPPSWLKTPPLSLVYLKNYLEQKGVSTKILDFNMQIFNLMPYSRNEWLSLNINLEKNLFHLVEKEFPGILETFFNQIKNIEYIGFSILKRNAAFSCALAEKIKVQFPDKKIIFGGPEALFLERQNRLDGDYFWVIGEGETPLIRIITGAENSVYRFCEIENLDNLPFLNFDAFVLRNYSASLPILSSRGCTHNCTFCSEKKLYKMFRHHSFAYLVEEIKYLTQKYTLNNFIFCDSLINYNRNWLEGFCRAVLKNGLQINWEAQIRVDGKFPLELAKLMKKSGCYNLFVGFESASDKILKSMNKGFSAHEAMNFFKILKQAGLHFEISLIFGYPGETEEDFEETLEFVILNKKIIPKIAQANAFIDYLGGNYGCDKPPQSALARIRKFIKKIEEEKIKYTKSFINNLNYNRQ